MDEFEPQLLHINTEFIIAEFAMLYSKFRKIPIIYTFHTHWDVYIANYLPVIPAFIRRFIVRGILSKILSRSDTVIVPTIEARKILRQYNIGNKIQILPTGIDPAPFCYDTSKIKLFRQYMEKKFPVLRGKKLLLFAGRLTQEKNILFILKLLPCIIKRHSDIMLVISGDGPFALELRRQSKEIKIDKNCLFTGYMPHNELIWLYSMAYIFVFPSLTETQGLVTLEAMTAGIPVVAISSMGTKAVMAGGRGGFLVPNNPKIFTKKVLLLLENKKIYKIKAKEARRNAENWFIDIMIDRLLAIYRNTIIKTI
ncbi:MAG: hypothetical protein Pg6A_16320 [Termitinemataceae bacterium]|nr:MAG: hypothetical protein Pg6A_16320 [Termitinemataceae bacterium]